MFFNTELDNTNTRGIVTLMKETMKGMLEQARKQDKAACRGTQTIGEEPLCVMNNEDLTKLSFM